MISFFRRALSSWIVLGLLGLIMIAFIVTGVGTPSGLDNLSGGSSRLAKIGGSSLSVADASLRIQAQLDNIRQERPGLDMAAFIQSGGADEVIEQMINGRAFEEFGRKNGMAISSRLVDGEIASIPAFRGPSGAFDRNAFLSVLSQRKLTEAMVRGDIARDKMTTSLIVPVGGVARAPLSLSAPYASLLLETRTGQIGFVPSEAVAQGPAPTEAELAQFYQRNTARYTVPETRVIRYATFDRKRFEGSAAATEAEIAEAYKANASQYASKETRVFSQVVVPTQAAAQAIVAKAKSGTALADAAKASGAEATTLAAQDEIAYAGLTSSPAIAKAAFAAAKGSVLDPQKSPLGWLVIRVDTINSIGGKSLADVRGQLATEISKRKVDGLIADFVTKIEDEVADGATFDEIVKKEGLAFVTTPAITASGVSPDAPGTKPSPELQPILRDAFQAEPDDDASVVTIAPNQLFGFYDLDKVNSAAPKPLAQIRQQVSADFVTDRAAKAARKLADAIAAKANQGTAFATAVSSAGVPLPAVKPMRARRIEIARSQQKVPPPLNLLFQMAPRRAKVLEAENKQGWYIVWLDSIVPGNAASEPGLIQGTQQELSRAMGEEYVQQFAAAIRADIGVKKNDAAVAGLKRSLSGAASSQ